MFSRLASPFALAFLLALITACTSDIDRSERFNITSEEGLVVFGVSKASTRAKYQLEFRSYDSAVGDFVSGGERVTIGDFSDFLPDSRGFRYRVGSFPPGTYVLSGVRQNYGYKQSLSCLARGSISFTVEPGKIAYIGNINLKGGGLLLMGKPNESAAAKFLKRNYPNVRGKLVYQKPKQATFPQRTGLFGGASC